jgi:hypothetical protein
MDLSAISATITFEVEPSALPQAPLSSIQRLI